MNKSLLFFILRMLFGAMFVASAVLKLFPLDYFELILMDQLGLSWSIVPLFARGLVLFEFALGVAILAGWQLRWSLYGSLAMLLVFSLYLVVQIASGNGAENCGCFGELIPLDGLSSLIKNVIFIALGGILLWKSKEAKRWRIWWAAPILVVIAIPAMFLAFPMPEFEADADFELDMALLERNDPHPEDAVINGEKLVVIMLAKCVHCAQLGSLIAQLDPAMVDDELRIIVLGKPEDVTYFIDKTGLEDFHYLRSGDTELLRAIEGKFPTAVLVRDGELVSKWKGAAVNIGLMSEHLDLNP
jgi:uncharacterized membrane protein YphA (DoxX/SURF4 family)